MNKHVKIAIKDYNFFYSNAQAVHDLNLDIHAN